MFCAIYVSRDDRETISLMTQLSDLLKLPRTRGSLESEVFSLDVLESDEYDPDKQKDFPKGFLYFPVRVEITFYTDDISFASPVVAKILEYLWENKYAAIAACSFEELLPENSGPWPS